MEFLSFVFVISEIIIIVIDVLSPPPPPPPPLPSNKSRHLCAVQPTAFQISFIYSYVEYIQRLNLPIHNAIIRYILFVCCCCFCHRRCRYRLVFNLHTSISSNIRFLPSSFSCNNINAHGSTCIILHLQLSLADAHRSFQLHHSFQFFIQFMVWQNLRQFSAQIYQIFMYAYINAI